MLQQLQSYLSKMNDITLSNMVVKDRGSSSVDATYLERSANYNAFSSDATYLKSIEYRIAFKNSDAAYMKPINAATNDEYYSKLSRTSNDEYYSEIPDINKNENHLKIPNASDNCEPASFHI